MQSSRQQQKDTAREDWQGYGTQRQEDRQSYGEDARRQRQDYADDYLDDYHGRYYGGGYYGSYPVGAGLAVAGAIAVGTVITASAFSAMSCPMTPVVMGGYTYYQCGSPGISPPTREAR